MRHFFTSESVTEGHPDKMCDQVSDAVLDAILEKDKKARVACECSTTTGLMLVMGEITTDCYVDIQTIARRTISEIGYTRAKFGFDADTCSILTSINEQSSDIAMGVDLSYEAKEESRTNELGAGDQGIMFGYACRETDVLMPLPIIQAHRIARRLAEARKSGEIAYLRPDGKSQVTVEYEDDRPVRIDTVVVSTQHDPEATHEQIFEDVKNRIILPTLPKDLSTEGMKLYVNPTGRFVTGGPLGDSGLTGRKIIVDTYGGAAPHGGGAFSGKDPTKVDRSAAYMARYVAKNIVAAGIADKCCIELAYAIGVAEPVSIYVDTYGTAKTSNENIAKLIRDRVDLRPGAIIEYFDLLRPIYRQTAAYGHFGRDDIDLPWEKIDENLF